MKDFLQTIYLGDRACKSIIMDGWLRELRIQISCISRIRSGSWNYDTSEDMENGYLVFEGVESVIFDPVGYMPNDWIEIVSIESNCSSTLTRCVLSAGAVDKKENSVEVLITVVASGAALDDANGTRIRI